MVVAVGVAVAPVAVAVVPVAVAVAGVAVAVVVAVAGLSISRALVDLRDAVGGEGGGHVLVAHGARGVVEGRGVGIAVVVAGIERSVGIVGGDEVSGLRLGLGGALVVPVSVAVAVTVAVAVAVSMAVAIGAVGGVAVVGAVGVVARLSHGDSTEEGKGKSDLETNNSRINHISPDLEKEISECLKEIEIIAYQLHLGKM